ncbi:MAG: DUF362 domain-containing protein [Dehalococcoidales bacterium]|nr:DUF362 domain-containing protein [Dehalococcoidales bacterium]
MIFNASKFVFKVPSAISRARRVLIKPNASNSLPYPVTTSRELLSLIIDGIRQVSDADILLLDGTPGGDPIYPIYKALGYDFPRVILLDVKDCIWVEVDNPLPKPLAVSTFFVPNVILSSDYLISVAPLKIVKDMASLSVMNLLSLLPSSKYGGETGEGGWPTLYNLGIDKVVTDLYFTLPFDLGIIEGRQKFISQENSTRGEIEKYDKVFVDEPYQVDTEAVQALSIKTNYLEWINEAKVEFEGGG